MLFDKSIIKIISPEFRQKESIQFPFSFNFQDLAKLSYANLFFEKMDLIEIIFQMS